MNKLEEGNVVETELTYPVNVIRNTLIQNKKGIWSVIDQIPFSIISVKT